MNKHENNQRNVNIWHIWYIVPLNTANAADQLIYNTAIGLLGSKVKSSEFTAACDDISENDKRTRTKEDYVTERRQREEGYIK